MSRRALVGSLLLLAACSAPEPAWPQPAAPSAARTPAPELVQPSEQPAQQLEASEEKERWISGTREVEIDRPLSLVREVIFDPNTYWSILPHVKAVKLIERVSDTELVVGLTQGLSFISASYAVRVRLEGPERVRIWLEKAYPHDIEQAEILVELTEISEGRGCNVRYQVKADIGTGVGRALLRGRIEKSALRPPLLLKNYVEGFPR